MALLERSDALAVLAAAHTSASAGEGRVVLVTGDAGIGKTALVQEFLASDPEGRVLRGAADDLATPLPLGALRDIARQGSPVLEDAIDGGRDELYPLFVDELERRPHPIVLVVEDVHWADEATIDVLTLVGRRIEGLPVALILTYRDHEVDAGHPVRAMIGHLPVGAVERIGLEPLSVDAVGELVPDADQAEVHELTGGNPFFVTALAAAGGTVTDSIADVVMRRVTRLGEDERALAELLSVAPGGLTVPVLDRAAPEWPDSAAAADRAGLVEVVEGRLAYRHEIARHAVSESLAAVRRLSLHGQLVTAMRDAGSDPAQLVHHAERAGDEQAVAQSAPAAAAAAVAAGAHREAVDHLERVLRTADFDGESNRASVEEEYSTEAWAANQAAKSRDGAFAARDSYRAAGSAEGAARASRLAARATWYFGDTDAAIRLIDESLAEIDGDGEAGVERARSLAYRALVGGIGHGPDAVEPYATDALALLDGDVDDETRALVLNNVATARSRNGIDPGDLLHQALAHAERAGAATEYVRILANRAAETVNTRDYAAGAAALEDALAGAEARQVLAFHPFMSVTRARHALETDDWEQAESAARWVLGDDVDAGFAALPARTVLARLAVRRGERTAKAEVESLWADASESGEFQWIGPAAAVAAEHALLRDHADDAHQPLERAAALATGALPSVAAELAAWAHRAGVQLDLDPGSGAHAAEVAGDWETAAASWDELGCGYEAATVRAWWGGEAEMLGALSSFDTAGATGTASWLRSKMRAAGIKRIPKGPSGATRQNPAGLTKRQVDVLLLVADGMTNAEIAEELFLSTRTVDHHVSAVLMKLDVSSRRDAAQKVSELGLS